MSEVYWGLAGTLGTGIQWRERDSKRERQTDRGYVHL